MDVVNIQEIRAELLEYFDTSGGLRHYVGFDCLDMNYGIREGSRTDWTGYPGSGKTELLIECVWNTMQYYDHKYLVHMPDAGSRAETIAKLFHKVTGKRMEKHYWDKDGKHTVFNRATKQDIDRYLPEILHFFKIYTPPKKKLITPKALWDYGVEIQKEENIFGVICDSWNNLHHDTGDLREDKWLAKTLQYGNALVEDTGLHFHTIIHPRSVKMKDGKAIMPSYHEMKGGSEWGNYAKTVIVVHREKNVDYTDVSFEKVKGANIGVKGLRTIHYDVSKGKYYEVNMTTGEKMFAKKPLVDTVKIDTEQLTIETKPLQPNKDFEKEIEKPKPKSKSFPVEIKTEVAPHWMDGLEEKETFE